IDAHLVAFSPPAEPEPALSCQNTQFAKRGWSTSAATAPTESSLDHVRGMRRLLRWADWDVDAVRPS
ncbi:hypothetical protein, partial [Micromonospora sp. NPDC004704]